MMESLEKLQLHNVFAQDDPFGAEATKWYSHVVEAGAGDLDYAEWLRGLMRTSLFIFKTPSLDVLQYVANHGLIVDPSWITAFNVDFIGTLGDGATTETSTSAGPEYISFFFVANFPRAWVTSYGDHHSMWLLGSGHLGA